MRVKEVFPCVCISHKPDTAVSTYYGMPELRTNGSFWQIRCPRCGRGGLMEFSSQYYALKDWNEMQIDLWRDECRDFWEGKKMTNVPEWRHEIYERMIGDEDQHRTD